MERTILEKDEIKGQQLNPFQKSVKVFFLNIQFSLRVQTDHLSFLLCLEKANATNFRNISKAQRAKSCL